METATLIAGGYTFKGDCLDSDPLTHLFFFKNPSPHINLHVGDKVEIKKGRKTITAFVTAYKHGDSYASLRQDLTSIKQLLNYEFKIDDNVKVKDASKERMWRDALSSLEHKQKAMFDAMQTATEYPTGDQINMIRREHDLMCKNSGIVIGYKVYGLPASMVCNQCYLVKGQSHSGLSLMFDVLFLVTEGTNELCFIRSFYGKDLERVKNGK